MGTATGTDFYSPAVDQGTLTWVQRLILRRAHPLAIIADLIGITWAVYFFWGHNWTAALAVVIGARIIGLSLAWRSPLDLMAQSIWGRLALLHLHPVNVVIQSIGVIWAAWGIWSHTTPAILAGISVIFAGHAVGWGKVHKAFAATK